MSRLIARLILAMLLLPVAGTVLVLFFVFIIAGGGVPDLFALLAMWAIVYVVITAYWLALWHDMVKWTRRRTLSSLLLIPLAIGASAVLGVAIAATTDEAEVGVLIGGGVGPIVGVLGSVLIWRETPAERLERLAAAGRDTIACPLCGYNLTGLHEARCPECGARFTLEELLKAQPRQDCKELDHT